MGSGCEEMLLLKITGIRWVPFQNKIPERMTFVLFVAAMIAPIYHGYLDLESCPVVFLLASV